MLLYIVRHGETDWNKAGKVQGRTDIPLNERGRYLAEATAELTGIFPLLFVPAAAGVMDLWADLQAMLVPVLLALIPITILVMTVSGCVTQRLAERKEKKQ